MNYTNYEVKHTSEDEYPSHGITPIEKTGTFKSLFFIGSGNYKICLCGYIGAY
ncbi:hypothetical protein GCM10008934_15420 [Virgibacillus salarius]